MSVRWKKILFTLLAIITSGLMTAALVPPYSLAGLAWFSLIPFLIATWSLGRRHRVKKGFLIGYLTGLIIFGIQVSWLATVSLLAPVLLAGYLALFFGAFGAFTATLGNPWRNEKSPAKSPAVSLLYAFICAAVFAGLEVARGYLLTGFGWNALGVAFHDTLVISQAADILGVSGLSLLLVFFQAVIVQVSWRLVLSAREGKKAARWDFIIAAGLVALTICYGLFRIASESKKESYHLEALLVQANIPHEGAQVLWSAEEVHLAYEDDTLAALKKIDNENEKLLQKAIGSAEKGEVKLRQPDWVLWPETALTGRMLTTDDGTTASWMQNATTINRVREASGNFDLIYGVIETEGETHPEGISQKDDSNFYNSIAIDSADGTLQTFRKQHLVIFGETIPLIESFPFLKKIYEQQSGQQFTGSFTSGEISEPLETLVDNHPTQIIPAVCFEDTVPRQLRKFLRNSPQVIVNLTNDGWFKTSPAAEQHFANARFRAIEFRRPMLRCANTGVSAAITTLGTTIHPQTGLDQRILSPTGSPFVRATKLVNLQIPIEPTVTIYGLIGDWGISALALIALFTAFFIQRLSYSENSQ